MEALDTLGKEYIVQKKIEYKTVPINKHKYPVNVWFIEEVNTSKVISDGNEIVKLICNDCGTSITGKRILLEGKCCIHNLKHNTTIVLLDKE
nr:hypothetical protein [Bacillus sp. TH13]